MKLIITESQKEKVLRDLIKNNGVEFASNIVGDTESLFDALNVESPMDFLHLFDDLDIVQSKEKGHLILFRYKPKHNLMVYNTKNEFVYINYDEIWSFFESNFGLNDKEIQGLMKKWLGEVYNLRGITTAITYNNPFLGWVRYII